MPMLIRRPLTRSRLAASHVSLTPGNLRCRNGTSIGVPDAPAILHMQREPLRLPLQPHAAARYRYLMGRQIAVRVAAVVPFGRVQIDDNTAAMQGRPAYAPSNPA